MKLLKFALCILIVTILSCKEDKELLIDIPAFASQSTLNCVIEIPAGTSKKYELDKNKNSFTIEIIDGKERIKPYLPFPANYGFVPGTYSDKADGGDGDPIDVFVISETLPQGTVLEVIPLGMLRLLDEGEMDDKIIAIPADKNLQTITATSWVALESKYPKISEIIALWLANSDRKDSTITKGWVDEKAAIEEVKRLEQFFEEIKK
jgi:inorganic pyrophosphatase